MNPGDFEKLGVFYLGAPYDPAARRRTSDLLLFDSKDLVTHAVCVGMTGSGKTGLCLTILEEAAIDGIPAIVIDPKGDLANLLLTFPALSAADFRPWINEEDARKKGISPDEFAARQAATWRNGLEEWGQDGARIQRLKDAAEVVLYTPGSNAARPVSVLKSFAAPPQAILDDPELLRERIASTVASLLGLMGIAADAITGREHILLSTILHRAWQEGEDLDIPALIQRIQNPGFTKLGVMELETVYPSGDRFALAMALNNLVASPGFGAWMEGEPLDIGAMLCSPEGKPRIAIFSIAHLADAERMFFVSLLLNQTLGWVRTQSGTSSLRALVYMDEIAGYFPPVANPPSKAPLLTLMKQARAFGVGVILATQNPVDLDYKGLANAGTWFIGRLQTERDKARVLDGLEGAMAAAAHAFDRAEIDRLLSSLTTRVFLMNNIHEDAPVIFETRWAMSYLRGPLTRQQMRALSASTGAASTPGQPTAATSRQPTSAASQAPSASTAASVSASAGASPASQRPVLPPEIPQYFLPARARGPLVYRPMVMGSAKVYYSDAKSGVEADLTQCLLALIAPGPVSVDWDHAENTELHDSDVEHEPAASAKFEPLPVDASKPKSYDSWKKSLADALYRTHRLELFRSAAFKAVSTYGETQAQFRLRLQQLAREQRDAKVEKLREKYTPRLTTLHDRLRRAEQAVEVQKEQASAAKTQTAISFGSAIIGALLGRKIASAGNVGRAATAARGVSRSAKESSDIGRAQENAEAIRQQFAALEAEFKAEAEEVAAEIDGISDELETIALKPKKTGITVRAVVLVWAPHNEDGSRAWT